MAVEKVTGEEAEHLHLNFEVTREMFEASLPQLDALLSKKGLSRVSNTDKEPDEAGSVLKDEE